MNKAFTREDDSSADDLDGATFVDPLPAGSRNYITPGGLTALREELSRLSANASVQPRPTSIERRLRYLERHIEMAEIIDPARQPRDRVLFGAHVTVRTEEGHTRTWSIVGVDEADHARGRISWTSPLARALQGLRVGNSVSVPKPKGSEDIEILEIHYDCP
jgi:transcription elongation factor GreB